MARRRIAASLAAMLVILAFSVPARADEGLTITIYRFARLSPMRGTVTVTGTIACDAEDEVHLRLRVTQGDLSETDNLDLSPFACSTTPRPFGAVAESFGCPDMRGLCFRPGGAQVELSTIPADTLVAAGRVVVRPSNVTD
jgi:hypothetical protein